MRENLGVPGIYLQRSYLGRSKQNICHVLAARKESKPDHGLRRESASLTGLALSGRLRQGRDERFQKDPDERIWRTIELVFAKFFELCYENGLSASAITQNL